MSQTLCTTLWNGFNKVVETRAALQKLLDNSDQDGFSADAVAAAIKDFNDQKTDYETLLNNSATLPDGRPIYATDYLALCKLATDNSLTPYGVSAIFRQNVLNSTGRVSNVNLTSFNLVKISALKHLTAITELYLGDNQIKDLKPIENLTALTALVLDNNQIEDLSPIKNLTALTWLGVSKNQIKDLKPIENLTALTALVLDNNQIADISPIQNLTALIELSLNLNQIVDLSPILNLNNLLNFTAQNNPLSDASKAILAARSKK